MQRLPSALFMASLMFVNGVGRGIAKELADGLSRKQKIPFL